MVDVVCIFPWFHGKSLDVVGDNKIAEFCTKFHNECASTTQKRALCSFNPAVGRFMCGCPFGMRRTDRGICVPFNLPSNPGDCADIQRLYGSTRSGIYSAYDEWKCNNSTTLCKFDVHCDMQMFGGGWTIILQRLNTSLSFERNFSDYEKGFALDEQNFWIGTNRLYRLTNRPQCPNELLLRLVASSNAATILMRYSHFIVSNPSTGYRLNLGPLIYSNDPNGKDEMNDARMEAFETIPKWECIDGGGWWRKRCNQRGVLTASNIVDRQYRGLMWNQQRLSALQMLIRPRLFMRRNT